MRNASQAGFSSESGNGSVIVLPLMIAGGSITDSQIPKLLEGYECRYEKAALASSPFKYLGSEIVFYGYATAFLIDKS